jgi:RNA polymerase sigma-70 factor (ECF subfamily)
MPIPSPFEQQLVGHHSDLLRYAHLQLRNLAWAQDAVSETMLAALAKPQAFQSRSQLKTWLIGILKHKVLDQFREHRREVGAEADPPGDAEDPLDRIGFQEDGHFREPPADWGDPQQELHQRQFLRVMEACMQHLPSAQGRLFLMREWLEMSVEDICKELALTPTNLYVQLHRARLRLRECLQVQWFSHSSPP